MQTVFSVPTSEATVSESATATSVLPLKRLVPCTCSEDRVDNSWITHTPQTQLNKSLLRFMNQDSTQMHFITGMNTVPHMTVSLTLP